MNLNNRVAGTRITHCNLLAMFLQWVFFCVCAMITPSSTLEMSLQGDLALRFSTENIINTIRSVMPEMYNHRAIVIWAEGWGPSYKTGNCRATRTCTAPFSATPP